MKNELTGMFRYPSMVKSGAFCAASFAFLSVMLKNGIVLIPEVSEVRVCNIVSCCFGIWFGPAGAVGCAFGNLIGDMAGSLTKLSFAGCFANFVSAWIPYKIWGVLGSLLGEDHTDRPSLRSKAWFIRYLLSGFASVVACSCILAVTFDASGDMPAVNTFFMIFLNNMGAAVIGIGLFALMCCVPEKVLIYWRLQMRGEREAVFVPSNKKAVIVCLASDAAVFIAMACFYRFGSDGFGCALPLAICSVGILFNLVPMLACRWKKPVAESSAISLD